ncbi:MAG: tol-pal system protein YbgF [Pseudomonadota bacterium]
MIRSLACVLIFLAGPALAQDRDRTLADIRQELSVLALEIQKLNRELSTTSGPTINLGGQSGIDRLNAIEAAVANLTRQTEALQNRINGVVADGSNQIGDLQFRLCELTPDCDLADLPEAAPLGGEAAVSVPSLGNPQPDVGSEGVELAVGEAADFETAKASLAAGNNEEAAAQFAAFTQNYPGGPMSGEAHFLRGEALTNLGQWNAGARAYLESYSGAPNDARAPEALFRLGVALNELGRATESCQILQAVESRYPGSEIVAQANTTRSELACP